MKQQLLEGRLAWSVAAHYVVIGVTLFGVLFSFTRAEAQNISFDAGTNIFTSNPRPFALAKGDFNKDGKLDFVVALDGRDAEIFFGDGAGAFSSSLVVDSGGAATRAVTVADYNEDTNLDIALANSDDSNVKVLFGNGAGAFSSGPIITTSEHPRSILSVDMNNDGNLDIVVSSITGNAIDIASGNGAGGFSSAVSFPVGSRAERIKSGDFNKDGNLDIVVTGPSVKLLLGDGAGNLGAATVITSSRFDVEVADFDGDGNLDVVLGEPGIGILFGTGAGSFSAIVSVAFGANDGIAASDLDNDGDTDIAATEFNLGTVVVLRNDGTGSFVVDSNLTAVSGVLPIVAGDFSNNGFDDLVVGHVSPPNNTRITIYKSSPAPSPAPEIDVQRPAGTSIVDGGTDAQDNQVAGTALTQIYTVENTGTTALNVTNITSAVPSNATVNSISTTAFTVAAGSTATFDVQYTPTAAGVYSFELDITSNDGDEANYDITVSGTAVATPELATIGDSFLRRGPKNRNEGANPIMRVRKVGKNRALVRFDAAEISNFGTVTKATLRLNISGIGNNWGAGRTVDAHPLNVEFAEGNGKAAGVPGSERTRGTGQGTTWKCAIDTDISNRKTNCSPTWRGGDFSGATAAGVTHTNGQTGAVEWDVTADVRAGTTGWLIRKTREDRNGKVLYYSREGAAAAGDSSLAPTLILK